MSPIRLLLIISLHIISVTIHAQIGQPDLSFNANDPGFHSGINANNVLNTIAKDNQGRIYVGGAHTAFNTYTVGHITRLTGNGIVDPSFNQGTGFNDDVRIIRILDNQKILVSGDFTTYNGTACAGLIQLNEDGTIDNTFSAGTGFNQTVKEILPLADGRIMIAGYFTIYNGNSVFRVIRLNSDGSLDGSFQTASGANGQVNTIRNHPQGGYLIAGNFIDFGGTATGRLAHVFEDGTLDLDFNTALGSGFASNVADARFLSTGDIVAAGSFTSFNGTTVPKLVMLNSNLILHPNFFLSTGPSGSPAHLFISETDQIYVAGPISLYNGIAVDAIFRLSVTGNLETSFEVENDSNSTIIIADLLFNQENEIHLVGNFSMIDSSNRNNIVALDQAGVVLNTHYSHTAFSDGIVYCFLEMPDGKILVGGYFDSYFETPVNGIIRLNPDGSLDETFNYSLALTQVNGVVNTMKFDNSGNILIGGSFSQVNNTAVSNFARLNSEGMLDTFFTPNPNAGVYGILVQADNKILVGGNFTSIAGENESYFVRLTNNGVLDDFFPGNSAPDAIVEQIEYMPDGSLLIAGEFYNFVNVQRVKLAHLNSSGQLLNDFNSGISGNFQSFTIQPDGKVIICGQISLYGSTSIPKIARLTNTGVIDPTFNIGTGANTGTLKVIIDPDQKIVVAGEFTTFNGNTVGRIVRLNADGTIDNSFQSGAGADHVIYCMERLSSGRYIIGGTFVSYDGIGRNRIATLYSCAPSYSTITQSGCDSITLNDETFTTSGIFDQIIVNSAGCDSLITLDLTIASSDNIISYYEECNSFTWNNIEYDETGVYSMEFTNLAGCDSIVTLNLTIYDINTGVQQTGNTLSSLEAGATYQWIDCNNGSENIPNATNQTYHPNSSGSYAVIITENGCTEVSECFDFTYIGLEDIENSSTISVYPNPATSIVQFSLGNYKGTCELQIVNQLGQVIIEQSQYDISLPLDITALPRGLYYARVNKTYSIKFEVQ